jgi:hypothetical protein
MDKIELTKEQIEYLSDYLQEEIDRGWPTAGDWDLINEMLTRGIDAFNGGAR